MYEVEFKVEITEAEKAHFIDACSSLGFSFTRSTIQNDFYIEATPSIHGGYDLRRYRDEDGVFIYTEKNWEVSVDGHLARKENEHKVSKENFDSEIAKYPGATTIHKERSWYEGVYEGREISLTLDSVKFDHSPSMRYFIEAEIGEEDIENVKATKEFLISFLKKLLNKEEIIESPGMFSMAFKKL